MRKNVWLCCCWGLFFMVCLSLRMQAENYPVEVWGPARDESNGDDSHTSKVVISWGDYLNAFLDTSSWNPWENVPPNRWLYYCERWLDSFGYSIDGSEFQEEEYFLSFYSGSPYSLGNVCLEPGKHHLELREINHYCYHGLDENGSPGCLSKHEHTATGGLDIDVIEAIAITGPNDFRAEKQANEDDFRYGPYYGSVKSKEDILLLPVNLFEPYCNETLKAVSNLDGVWPKGQPIWNCCNMSMAGKPASRRLHGSFIGTDTVDFTTDTPFYSSIYLTCGGYSYISTHVAVVGVASVKPVGIYGTDNMDDMMYYNMMGIPGRLQEINANEEILAVRRQDEKFLRIKATPTPEVKPYGSLNGDNTEPLVPDEWTFGYCKGERVYRPEFKQVTPLEPCAGKFEHFLDLSSTGKYTFEASCGTSKKTLIVYVYDIDLLADINCDGAIDSSDNAKDANGDEYEENSPGLILARCVEGESKATHLSKIVPLYVNVKAIKEYDDKCKACFGKVQSNGKLMNPPFVKIRLTPPPGVSIWMDKNGTENIDKCNYLFDPWEDNQVFYVSYTGQYGYCWGNSITATVICDYDNAVDSMVVTPLDLDDPNQQRVLLVNDDNDDFLASQGLKAESPNNTQKDCNQKGEIPGEDDLLKVAFPFNLEMPELWSSRMTAADFWSNTMDNTLDYFRGRNIPVTFSLSSSGSGICLWTNEKRNERFPSNVTADVMKDKGYQVIVEGTAATGQLDGVKLVGTWAIGARKFLEEHPLTVLDLKLAVEGGKLHQVLDFDDYGKSGDIGNFGDAKAVFWVNDDYDVIQENVSLFESPQWEEDDDRSAAQWQNWNDDSIGRRSVPASQPPQSSVVPQPLPIWPSLPEAGACKRDLEDFARMQMRFDPVFAQIDNLEIRVKSNPSINLFPAVDTSMDYLKDAKVADKQVTSKKLVSANYFSTVLPLKKSQFNGKIIPFIWEGCSEGDGWFAVEVWVDGKYIGNRKVAMSLKRTEKYRMMWRKNVGYQNAINGYFCEIPADWENCLVIVHGFNVTENEKNFWADTVYKRLYWQGYRGRIIFFSWNCVLTSGLDLARTVNVYDDSDFYAWQSGSELAKLLIRLKGACQNLKLSVLAHSQGNVVTGEALRQIPYNLGVNTYIASQAAISGSCYSKIATLNSYATSAHAKNPEILADYPGWTTQDTYLASVPLKVNSFCNFYNQKDYALTYFWLTDNKLKPNIRYAYSWDLKKFTIKLEQAPNPFLNNGYISLAYYPLDFGTPTNDTCTMDIGDSYTIFSYAAISRAKPLGMCPKIGAGFDLASNLGYDELHYSHSRQFRSNIADEWKYWEKVKNVSGFNTSTQPGRTP